MSLPDKITNTGIILGSGPSLDGFDYSLLEGKFVIAINDAGLEQYPDAPVLFSTDERFCQSLANGDRDFAKWCGDWFISTEPEALGDLADHSKTCLYQRRREMGLSDDPECLHGIYTGVHAAINYLVHCHVKRIVLLGVDLRADPPGGRKYTYGGETTVRTQRQFKNMLTALTSCAETLRKKKIDVITGSEQSALTCWPRMSPADAVCTIDRCGLEVGQAL